MCRIIKCLLLIFSLIFCLLGCSNVRYKSVPPASKEMKYLLFPTQAYRNTLNRAIIVSGEELYAGSKIAYYVGDNEVLCDKSNFTLLPDTQVHELVKRLNDELVKWGKATDYRRIEYWQENGYIRLKIIFKSGRKAYFQYKTAGVHIVSSAENGVVSAIF